MACFTFLWIIACLCVVDIKEVYTWKCPEKTWKKVFARPSSNVTLPFQFHRDDFGRNFKEYRFLRPSIVIFHLLSNKRYGLFPMYNSRYFYAHGHCTSLCSIIGNTTAGNFTFQIESVDVNMSGVYVSKDERQNTMLQCITLYVLGEPTKPTIEATNPQVYEGQSETLFCNKSASTTIPNNHTLNLTYNWYFDGKEVPYNRHVTYFDNKYKLELTSEWRPDNNESITCSATEDVTGGYSSLSSEPFFVNVSTYSPNQPTVFDFFKLQNNDFAAMVVMKSSWKMEPALKLYINSSATNGTTASVPLFIRVVDRGYQFYFATVEEIQKGIHTATLELTNIFKNDNVSIQVTKQLTLQCADTNAKEQVEMETEEDGGVTVKIGIPIAVACIEFLIILVGVIVMVRKMSKPSSPSVAVNEPVTFTNCQSEPYDDLQPENERQVYSPLGSGQDQGIYANE